MGRVRGKVLSMSELNCSSRKHDGFTLVELLVVIAIVGTLIGLLLPAVQAARESARRAQCSNQLRQIALACLQHEESQGFLPSNGWGYKWTGDPDMGYGKRQPGGWVYDILAYLEKQNIRDIGQGLPGPGSGGQKYERLGVLNTSIVEVMYCPSRRSVSLHPGKQDCLNAPEAEYLAKTDYAANGGTNWMLGPGTEEIECLTTFPKCAWDRNEEQWAWAMERFDGITTARSEVELQHITDGTSKTLLVAEKYLNPVNYEVGGDESDNSTMYQGNDFDTTRWAGSEPIIVPMQDTPYVDAASWRFGSTHASSMNAAFVDGSVRPIRYNIDTDVYETMGSRNGEEVANVN